MGFGRFLKRGGGQEGDDDARPEGAGERATGDDDLAARVADLSRSFGQMPPDEQKIAAIEKLTELRAAGKVSEENFKKERRRLERRGG